MRWRDRKYVVKLFIILIAVSGLIIKSATAQSICGPGVPSFNVNLTGNPGGTWTSNPPMSRGGLCCNAVAPDKCIEFVVTLDQNAIGINFQIASGAIPPGALYYQVDCGPMVAVGSPICLNGPGPYRITFCKPGNNINTYSITSIPKPSVSPNTITSDGCNIKIGATGLVESSISWTSIAPGTQGQYNGYLNCTTGCDTVKVTPLPGYPAYVDYKVCGSPLGGVCAAANGFCDTVRVYFVPPIANSISPNPASYCANNQGVMLSAVINGGAPPYTYIWKNSAGIVVGNNSTYTAMSPGSYFLEVQDVTFPGCPSKLSTVNVTVDPVPTANAGPDRTVCPGNPAVLLSGSVTNASGGVWSGGTGTFSPSANALNATYTPSASEISAGIVVLTLSTTGMGACAPVTDQMTINITQPLSVNAIMPQIICYGQKANITATPSGGTAPYLYSWSNGSTSQSIYNVSPGSYTVTVTDATANACTISKTFVLNQNAPLSLSVPSNSIITCDSSVYVNVSASGGSGNFTYLWNTGANTPGITVNSGVYIVTATDSLGCSVKDTVNIQAAGTAINATINQPSTLCYGGTTVLTANGTGGFGGYLYGWNTGQATQSITVPAGNYCVTVEDTVGCLYTRCVQVTEAPPLQVAIPTPGIVCYGASATVTAVVSGGTPPYNYLWSTGETSSSVTKPAGTYSVTVTDANSHVCTATASVTISQSADLSLSFTTTPVSCFGGNNGQATVSVTGGTSPYNYAWSPYGGNAATAYLLSAGTYTVNVYDNNGCTKSGTVTVSQPPLMSASLAAVNNVQCAGNMNGSATVSVSGGTPGYTYLWTPSGETTSTANSLPAGSNSVVIQDSKGCTKSLSVSITEPSPLVSAIGTSANVSCAGGNDGSATVLVSGGTAPYSYTWLETGDNTPSASNLYYGNYNVSIQDSKGCATTATVSITQPSQLTSAISATSNVTCFGANNGSATVTANGGSPGYNYSWSNGANTATISSLAPGSYYVTVTDLNGCQSTSSLLITQPQRLSFSQASPDPVTCAGLCNGEVTASASGGTGAYQYLWTPGNFSSPNVSGLCAGAYSIRITDQNGCFRDTTVFINEPQNLSLTVSSTGSNCGQANGSAAAVVSGGTPGYTYSWSTTPSQNTATASGLTPGSYTITVKDNNNCSSTASVIINNIPGVNATIGTYSNVTCNSNCNGTASVSLSGGASPYTYSWSTVPPQSTPLASNLCAGTYTVRVTGSDGCSDTASVTISQPQPLVLAQASKTNVSCYGDSTGSATVNATGGSGSFSYSWNTDPPQTGPVATGLTSGNYIATVTDANGCSDTLHVSIGQPASALQVSVTQSNINCFGGNNGSATATVSGGSPGYSYSWNTVPVQFTPTASNLSAGTYSATVTDSKGCSVASVPAVITQPTSAMQVTVSKTDIDCFGNNSGSIQTSITGGTAPFTYSWSTTPVQTGPNALNLSPGTYSVTVADAYGCTFTSSSMVITQPSAPVAASVVKTNVMCYGQSTGNAEATVTGGTSPYTYNWSSTPPQYNPLADSLTAGTYTLIVTDAKGCSVTDNSVIITQPVSPLTLNVSHTNINCYGSASGSASASVNGGTPGYQYSWSTAPFQNTPSAINLSAGTYSVSVSDQNGCNVSSAPAIITQPSAPLTSGIVSFPIECYGSSTGSIQTSATGGTSPYTYSWSTSPVQSGPTATGLAAGTYSVSISDSKGCVFNSNVINLSQPSNPLSVTVNTTDISCFGASTGVAEALVTGGTTPYTYSWSTSPTQTSPVIDSVTAGTYTLVVTDSKGCSYTNNSVVISQPSLPLSLTVSNTNNNCFGNATATATATVSGGTPGYYYSWSTSPYQNTPTAVNLSAGTYSVTVTDEKGCSVTSNGVIITQPAAPLSAAVVPTNIQCYGSNSGTIQANVSGGTAPYTYSWSTTPVQTSPVASGLSAGTYSLTVKDSKGCITSRQEIEISQPSNALTVTITKNNVNCFGYTSGSAEATVTGGTSPYTYSWSSVPQQQTPLADSLAAGTYSVLVTDQNGCTYTNNQVIITQPAFPLQVSTSKTDVSCYGNTTGSATVTVSGGTSPYTYSWNTTPMQNTASANGLTAGTYSVQVTDNNNCVIQSQSVIITQPQAPLTASVTPTHVSCFGNNTGSIQASVTGGSTPYTYSWSTTPVQTGAIASNLNSGTYSVSITDSKGCSVNPGNIVVTQPSAALTASVTGQNISCHGETSGSATAAVTGGTAPYTYSWSTIPAQVTPTADSLAAGTYSVIISDNKGCSFQSMPIIITQPSQPLNSNITLTHINCHGNNTGSAIAAVTGGTSPYTYSWSTIPSQNTAQVNSLAAGTYTLNVTDNNGCSLNGQQVVISQPAMALTVSLSKTDILCFGQNTGSVTATATGGTVPYTYSWNTSPVQTTNSISNLSSGYYVVTVTDNKGCVYSAAPIQITEPAEALSTSITSTDVSCYGGSDGTASVTVTGGTTPYSYSWNSSPAQSSAIADLLPAGNYAVKVTDGNGCITTTDPVSISQPDPLNASISNMTTPSCGTNNGSATVSATGGTGPYFYSWNTSPAQTLATASNLFAGTYMSHVTDMRGCRDSVSVTLQQPATVKFVSAAAFPTTCNESCDGYAVVIAGGGVAPYTYSWSNGGSGPAINNVCEGYYTIYVYDNKGCYADTVLHVTSPPPITLQSTVTPANCYQNNGSASVTPAGGMAAYSYSWSTTPPSFGSTLNGVVPGDYEVLVTDARGCTSSLVVEVPNLPGVKFSGTVTKSALCKDSCDGTATVTSIGGSAPYTYFWNTLPPQFQATANGLCAGTYKATVRDGDGCWDTVSVKVTEPDPVIAASTDAPVICIGESATLTASAEGGNGAYTYNWNYGSHYGQEYQVSPVSSNSYTVLVTDSNGCRSNILTIPVTVRDPLSVSLLRGDSICPGEVATVSAVINGGDGNYQYLWMPGNHTTPQFQASPGETMSYTLTVKDGCSTPQLVDSTAIVLLAVPEISFTADMRSGCKPLCVQFTNNSTVGSGNITSWNWSFTNGSQSDATNPVMCFNEDGSCGVRVEAISNHGCKSAVVLDNYIEVHPDPVADFVLGPQPADILNPLIQFTDKSSGAVSWNWTFNDAGVDSYSTDRDPAYAYSDTGNFCPVLKVTNEFGCISEKEDCLYINPEFAFYVPNAFSPNGDGYNETFTGKGTLVSQFEMLIFDRWGNLIFQTDNLDKPWDGSANSGSQPAQEDVYIYKMKVWDQNRKVHNYQGSVTLVK